MRRTYTDAEKAEALALYAEVGAAEAARQTGINRGTIVSWASRNGVAADATPNLLKATEVAAARRTFVATEFRARMVETLAKVAEKAAAVELERLAGSKATLHEVVGARTRAIHDLQLLAGEPTDRSERVTVDSIDREIERLFERAS